MLCFDPKSLPLITDNTVLFGSLAAYGHFVVSAQSYRKKITPSPYIGTQVLKTQAQLPEYPSSQTGDDVVQPGVSHDLHNVHNFSSGMI